MSTGTSYGHWHDLRVSETVMINVGDESERMWFDLSHPPQCGKGCGRCGYRPHCDLQYQLDEIGQTEVYGADIKPGAYKVRCEHHVTPSGPWGGSEYDVYYEVVPLSEFDGGNGEAAL